MASVSKKWRRRRRVAALLACIATVSVWRGIPAARGDDPNRFADRIQDCKNNSTSILNDLDQMLGDLQQAPTITRDDPPVFKRVMQAISNKYLEAAAAFTKGDEAEGNRLNEEAHRMNDQENILRLRDAIRGQERNLLISQDDSDNACGMQPPSYQQYYERFLEYRKRAVEISNQLCEMLTPETDPQVISDLRDTLQAAMVEADVSQRIADWARDDSYLTEHPELSSADISAAMDKLTAARRTMISDYRQQRLLERESEKLNDQYSALQRQRDLAVNAAQQANR